MRALECLRGTYGLVVVFRERPDVIVAARQGSPLVVGVGEQEHFIASDSSALAGYTDQIVYLADHQLALIKAHSLQVRERGRYRLPNSPKECGAAGAAAAMKASWHLSLSSLRPCCYA